MHPGKRAQVPCPLARPAAEAGFPAALALGLAPRVAGTSGFESWSLVLRPLVPLAGALSLRTVLAGYHGVTC